MDRFWGNNGSKFWWRSVIRRYWTMLVIWACTIRITWKNLCCLQKSVHWTTILNCMIQCYYIMNGMCSMHDISRVRYWCCGNISCKKARYRIYWCTRRSVLHELQSANVHYISIQQVPTLYIENCEQYCERDVEKMWEDYNSLPTFFSRLI